MAAGSGWLRLRAAGRAHDPRFAPLSGWRFGVGRGRRSFFRGFGPGGWDCRGGRGACPGVGSRVRRRADGRGRRRPQRGGGGSVRSCLGSLGVEHGSCRPVEFSLAGFGRLVVLVGEVRIRRRSGRRDRLGVGAHRKPAQDRGCRAWVADGRDEAVAPPAIALGGIDAEDPADQERPRDPRAARSTVGGASGRWGRRASGDDVGSPGGACGEHTAVDDRIRERSRHERRPRASRPNLPAPPPGRVPRPCQGAMAGCGWRHLCAVV